MRPAGAGAGEPPFSAAADRNKAPILDVLASVLPEDAKVLEIASGTGQHAAHCAAGHPRWNWQPSDVQAEALEGIAARCAGLANVRPAALLDVLAPPAAGGLGGPFDAIYCANMIHIAPWATCPALMRLAARELTPAGVLAVYGPFIEDGVPTAPGNLAFDADLRARNPLWGLRRSADVDAEAARAGLHRVQRHAMPANNLTLVFRRGAG
jgi:SAM-dependent methyltransferase